MDIHPPKHPIKSLREFLVEIFTVTCGILIALGLEQAIEWHRTEALLAHTRIDFRQEIEANRAEIRTVLASESALEDCLGQLIVFGEARLAHKPTGAAPSIAPIRTRDFLHLGSNAWEAALATQSVAHLPFPEARAVLAAYVHQQSLNDLSSHALQQWVTLSSFGDPSKVTDDQLEAALASLRVAYAWAGSIHAGAEQLLKDYDKAEASIGAR